MTSIMALEGVSARLGSHDVVRDVSLKIAAGQVVAIVGPNGAGKSSLLKILAGVLQPSSGSISIEGHSATALNAAERAQRVAYLPQQRAIHWSLSVRTVVGLGRLPHQALGLKRTKNDADIVASAMTVMDVDKFSERPVLELSGGEQARVLMARALAQEPKLLLADEPTAGLDLAHQLALAETLRAGARQGMACVVAVHDLTLAADIADIVVLLADGRIVAEGPPRGVLTPESLARIFGVALRVATVDGTMVFVPQAR